MGVKDYPIMITNEDIIDVKLKTEKNKVIGFAINLRCKIDDAWYAIYRIDTAHGYLHEQRFWISPEPIKLPTITGMSLKNIFDFYLKHLRKSWRRYKKYYEERMKLRCL